MTREEMCKIRWKPYMSVLYQDKGMKYAAECLLSAIDFDAEILTLTPLDDFYQQKEFAAHISFCSLSNKLKPSAINGKKVKERDENTLRAKKIGVWIDDEDDSMDDAS